MFDVAVLHALLGWYDATTTVKGVGTAMPRAWTQQLRKKPSVVRLRRLLRARLNLLKKDKEFVLETGRVSKELEKAFQRNAEHVSKFLRQFTDPTAILVPRIRQLLPRSKNKQVRGALWRYVRYVARFRVLLVLKAGKKRLRFEVRPIPEVNKFHVGLVRGRLVAIRPAHADAHYLDFFESATIEAPRRIQRELQKQIKSGVAKFLRIDDGHGYSVLKELEGFAYYPEGVTYILHMAEQPYLYCLIGEKVSKEDVRRAGVVVSAFQRECYRRGTAGRPPKLDRWRKVITSERKPGQVKRKAWSLWEDQGEQDLIIKQVYMSRIRKKLK